MSEGAKRRWKKRLDVLQQGTGAKVDLKMRHVVVFNLLWHNSGNFGDAAKWVGITQPAVSACLTSLEELCGFELFHRGGPRHAVPTTAAMRLFPHFDRAFRALNDLAIAIEQARPNPEYGAPFRTFRTLLEPADMRSTAADRVIENIKENTTPDIAGKKE